MARPRTGAGRELRVRLTPRGRAQLADLLAERGESATALANRLLAEEWRRLAKRVLRERRFVERDGA